MKSIQEVTKLLEIWPLLPLNQELDLTSKIFRDIQIVESSSTGLTQKSERCQVCLHKSQSKIRAQGDLVQHVMRNRDLPEQTLDALVPFKTGGEKKKK